jgi:hypothetical protein
VADEANVKVLTTKVGVTVGRLDLEDALLDFQNGDIKSTTTKIVDSDDTVSLLLKTIGKSGGGRFVDNTEDVETSNLTSILGSLTLRVVEVGRDSDNGVLDGLAQVVFSSLLHLVQNETTNLGGGVLLATSLNPGVAVGVLDDLVGDLLDIALNLGIGELATDETLGGEEGVFGVDNSLTFGSNTNQTLAILGESDNGGSCAGTLIGPC